MSKKAAEGIAALTLDVKIGKAALIADETAVRQLGHLLVTYRQSSTSSSTSSLSSASSSSSFPFYSRKTDVIIVALSFRPKSSKLTPVSP